MVKLVVGGITTVDRTVVADGITLLIICLLNISFGIIILLLVNWLKECWLLVNWLLEYWLLVKIAGI